MSDISTIVGVISLAASVFSIALAGVAIWFTYHTSQTTRNLLADIDKRATVVEEVAKTSQEKLLDTVTSIAAPKEPSQEQQLMNHFFSNPQSFVSLLQLVREMGAFSPGEPEASSDAGEVA